MRWEPPKLEWKAMAGMRNWRANSKYWRWLSAKPQNRPQEPQIWSPKPQIKEEPWNMGTKPGNRVSSIPPVDGRLLHRSMKGIGRSHLRGGTKRQEINLHPHRESRPSQCEEEKREKDKNENWKGGFHRPQAGAGGLRRKGFKFVLFSVCLYLRL